MGMRVVQDISAIKDATFAPCQAPARGGTLDVKGGVEMTDRITEKRVEDGVARDVEAEQPTQPKPPNRDHIYLLGMVLGLVAGGLLGSGSLVGLLIGLVAGAAVGFALYWQAIRDQAPR